MRRSPWPRGRCQPGFFKADCCTRYGVQVTGDLCLGRSPARATATATLCGLFPSPWKLPWLKFWSWYVCWQFLKKRKVGPRLDSFCRQNPGRREAQNHCLVGFLLAGIGLCAVGGQTPNEASFVHSCCPFHQLLPMWFQLASEGRSLNRGSLSCFGCNL